MQGKARGRPADGLEEAIKRQALGLQRADFGALVDDGHPTPRKGKGGVALAQVGADDASGTQEGEPLVCLEELVPPLLATRDETVEDRAQRRQRRLQARARKQHTSMLGARGCRAR